MARPYNAHAGSNTSIDEPEFSPSEWGKMQWQQVIAG
jgi:hypothetical protein